MTIYLTRSDEHHFWKHPFPLNRLFITSELTQLVTSLFAVYGITITPIGWVLAGLGIRHALFSYK